MVVVEVLGQPVASLEALGWSMAGREVVEALSLEVSPQWVGVLKDVGNVR